jgi:hypothetical protein
LDNHISLQALEDYYIVNPKVDNFVSNVNFWHPTKNNKRTNNYRIEVVKCTSIDNSFQIKKNWHLVLIICCNPNLGLTTKARACKGAGQEGSSGVTSYVPGSVGECEGMNTHTPKWAPILGVEVQMDSQIFRKQFQGSKPIGLKRSLYHWKSLGR